MDSTCLLIILWSNYMGCFKGMQPGQRERSTICRMESLPFAVTLGP